MPNRLGSDLVSHEIPSAARGEEIFAGGGACERRRGASDSQPGTAKRTFE